MGNLSNITVLWLQFVCIVSPLVTYKLQFCALQFIGDIRWLDKLLLSVTVAVFKSKTPLLPMLSFWTCAISNMGTIYKYHLHLGTCESFFFVRIESSNRISRIYHASRNTAWRSAGVPYYRPIICWRLALWTNESDLRNWVLVHFNSVIKRVKQCRCTLI